ncbi:uncharacterized protein LOC124408116 [Diprion similis]|uniref:uncharacterized protein LOC124408116 n=1 Tax=Diprion similis TaxID=362088 RepID=UPI001EF98738|nr:uncharacterized protein LOC124408116 [Diprion similis]
MCKLPVIVALLIVGVSGFPARMIDIADLETVRLLGNRGQANADPTDVENELIFLDPEDEEFATSEEIVNEENFNPDSESDSSFESEDSDDLEDDDIEFGLRRKRSMAWHVENPSKDSDDGAAASPVKLRWKWNDGMPELKPQQTNVFDGLNEKQSDLVRLSAPLVHYRRPCKSRFERRDRRGVCRPVIN